MRDARLRAEAQQPEFDVAVSGHISALDITRRQFLAGFFDGDGCIRFSAGPRRGSACVKVIVAQAYNDGIPPELSLFKELFSGGIYRGVAPKKETQRQSWRWECTTRTMIGAVVAIVADHGIIKQRQAETARKFLRGEVDGHDAWLACARAKDQYSESVITVERLTDAYLAGIFAAEGSVRIEKSLTVVIAQQCCPAFVYKLVELFDGAFSGNGKWVAYGNAAFSFLSRIRAHLFGQKVAQVDVAMAFVSQRQFFAPVSNEKRKMKQETKEKLKILKRL